MAGVSTTEIFDGGPGRNFSYAHLKYKTTETSRTLLLKTSASLAHLAQITPVIGASIGR